MNRRWPARILVLAWCLIALGRPAPAAKELLTIKGDYFLYSYDYNYLYGRGRINVKYQDFLIHADALDLDVREKIAAFGGRCQVQHEGKTSRADYLEIDLGKARLRLFTYGERVTLETLPPAKTEEGPARPESRFVSITLPELKKSLAYFLCREVVVHRSFAVFGYGATPFLEGLQSFSFKKFRMDKGSGLERDRPFQLDRIWFTNVRGLVVESSLKLERPLANPASFKSATTLELQYDLFHVNDPAPRGRLNLNSNQTLAFSPQTNLVFSLNWITDNMLHTALSYRRPLVKAWSTEWIIEYIKPLLNPEELWLRHNSSLNLKRWGILDLKLGYEKRDQSVADFSYSNRLAKNLSLVLRHSESRLIWGQDLSHKLSNSALGLSYTNKLFNVAADYSLHRDLLSTQTSPQLRLQATPFRLYDGLLRFNLQSVLMLNQFVSSNFRDTQVKANLGLNVETEKLQLGPGTDLGLVVAAEQFFDKEPSNQYVSLGWIVRARQLFGGADLEFRYNYQTRRHSVSWLIPGTHSQDWNAILRLKDLGQRLNGWISFSYDTKTGHFTTGYLDASLALIKKWYFQTQANYDFIFRNLNYNFYLIRKAGRFTLRASYRSLSRQFMIELLPG